MITIRLIPVALVAMVIAAGASGSEPAAATKPSIEVLDESFRDVVDEKAEVRQIAGALKFTEGPTWYPAEKCLLFSDVPGNRIYKWTEGDGLKVWRDPADNPNGNAIDNEGRLVTCEHSSRSVTRTGKDGNRETLCSTYKGKRLNSPNDVAVRADGTIWFTDPPYGIKPEAREQDANYVFRLDPGAKEPVAVASDFLRPNGLCFSPDGKTLYVADSDGKARHIRRFSVKEDKTLDGGEVFCVIDKGSPDGIRCDAKGRVFSSAADGVQVFSADGKLIGRIRTPLSAANLAFGGEDGKTLFITARTGVWAVKVK